MFVIVHKYLYYQGTGYDGMGCLFSKKSLSTSTPPRKTTTSTRVQYLSNSNSNGIVRVPKNEFQNDQHLPESTNEPNHENSRQLRMKPPPLAPPPSPPSSFESLNAEPTGPPTPEEERPSLYVQYVEDLQPVSPVPLKKAESTSSTADQYSRSKVSVSNVTLKSNVNGIRCAPMPMQDLSIEELDTEMDETNSFRLVYSRPARPKSESHLVRNQTFIVRHGFKNIDRPQSERIQTLTEPFM